MIIRSTVLALCCCLSSFPVVASPLLPGIGEAMTRMIEQEEIAGAVTVVMDASGVRHLESTGLADVASGRPMTPDTLFWIASMSKPVTAVAVLMLQDEGKLQVTDPVAKYIPAFADLKTPSGKAADLTITHILTHTSGLLEANVVEANVNTLAGLVPHWLAGPTQFEPGSQWKYSQSGINAAAHIVELVSGQSFDVFLEERLFSPLGMKDSGFYPGDEIRSRLATAYAKNPETGKLSPVPLRAGMEGTRNRPPQGNGGLFSTPRDYARFCQMLLAGGTLDGKTYLSAEAMARLHTPLTGDLPTGFFQSDTFGQRGKNYGWALGTCVLLSPHEGTAAMLSPGTFGHGGAWGTQAWIDPVKGTAYLLMVQRSNFPNADASEVRRTFQEAAIKALTAEAE